MTVVVLSNCPPKLRGDMTKWFMEINTGVYVGHISARVRQALWKRICDHVKHGQATMVFPAVGEQHMDFRIHNTIWEPVDYDGIQLMRRPSARALRERSKPVLDNGFSKAAQRKTRERIRKKRNIRVWSDYVVLDLETTSLYPDTGHIIEMGALRVHDGAPDEELVMLIASHNSLPASIVRLTGITDQMLHEEGIPLTDALSRLRAFIRDSPIVCHNLPFDMAFLNAACRKCGMELIPNACCDTLVMSRKQVKGVADYKLSTLAQYFGIEIQNQHRALADCRLTFQLYEKLNKI